MMLSQRIIVFATTACLLGVAGNPETDGERRSDERRDRKEAAKFAEQRTAENAKAARREAEVRAYLEEMLRSTEREAAVADTQRNLEEEIHGLQQIHRDLQLRELNIETEIQRQEISGNLDDVQHFQRELIEVRAERARHELEIERRMADLDHSVERRDIRRMRERLDYVSDWRSVAFDPQEAVMMATQAVVETGLASDDPQRAAKTLEELLGEIHDLGSRTAIRFALRDLYGELNRLDEAGDHMKQVVRENAHALDARHDDERQ